MLSSRPRNSTALDWLLAAALAAAVIVGAAGVDIEIGGISLRSHSAVRVLAVAAVIFAVRLRLGIEEWAAWLLRLTLATSIAFSVATWFRFLLTTIGGADSYGYVSAGRMLGAGRLIEPAPIADWLSLPNRLAVASPLGWAPAPDGLGLVPTYPLGVPAVMAAFRAVGGESAVFLVAPAFALVTLVLVYCLSRKWFDRDVALMATVVTAWNPVFITYAKQPMSDVPASAWLLVAIVLALRGTPAAGFFAGLAAGAAVITRPALLIAAAVVPLMASIRLQADTRGVAGPVVSGFSRIDKMQLALSAAGLGIGVLVQTALQAHLFGSAFGTGYGAAAALFSPANVAANLAIYWRQAWFSLSGMWVTSLVVGTLGAPPPARWPLLAMAAAVTLPYLFYLPFDHWETLRFLLPAMVPVSILAGAGLVRIARVAPQRGATVALLIVLTTALVVRNATLLQRESVWNIQSIEERYALAGQWLDVNTPRESVALANQHSGSLRWYGHRQTLRWDFLPSQELAATIRELESRGATVYVVLEGVEVEMFERRFAAVLDQLRIDHVGRVRNVYFRRLSISDR